MWKKFGVIALAVFGFGWTSGMNAGTEVIRDYGAQEPAYNYAPPPPRPVYYAPPPVSVVVYPAFYYAPGYRAYYGHRYYARRPYWHGHGH